MTPNTYQISEASVLDRYFSYYHTYEGFRIEAFCGKSLIIWPQELNLEVNNYFEKCFDWWVEVKEEDQAYSAYTVFNVTASQAREFIRAANEQKWGLGSHCYAMIDGEFKCGRD